MSFSGVPQFADERDSADWWKYQEPETGETLSGALAKPRISINDEVGVSGHDEQAILDCRRILSILRLMKKAPSVTEPQIQIVQNPDIAQILSDIHSFTALEADWDDDGGVAVPEAIANRADAFITEMANVTRFSSLYVFHAPQVSPVGNGSIDFHWNTGECELLVNTSYLEANPFSFYGDRADGTRLKGELDPALDVSWILAWLSRK